MLIQAVISCEIICYGLSDGAWFIGWIWYYLSMICSSQQLQINLTDKARQNMLRFLQNVGLFQTTIKTKDILKNMKFLFEIQMSSVKRQSFCDSDKLSTKNFEKTLSSRIFRIDGFENLSTEGSIKSPSPFPPNGTPLKRTAPNVA